MGEGAEGTDIGVRFEPAAEDDVSALVGIDAMSPRPWTEAAFQSELPHDPKTLFVLRIKQEATAFIAFRIKGSEADILNVAVADSKRHLGYGTLVMTHALAHLTSRGATEVFLEVRASNRAALNLYARLGFQETQKRRDFYEEPREDAILMRLHIGAGKQG